TRARPERVSGLGIARTWQLVRTFGRMTVLENVVCGALKRHARVGEARARALRLLEFTGLASREDVVAANLTLADKKRLEIARARRRRSSGTTRSSRPISASTTVGAAEPAPRGGTGPTPSASAPSASRDGALLEVRAVEVAYGAGVLALQGVSLAVLPGEIVA